MVRSANFTGSALVPAPTASASAKGSYQLTVAGMLTNLNCLGFNIKPIAQVAIGKAAPSDPMRITLVIPTNISIVARPQMSSKEGNPSLELSWQSRIAAGCFASAEISDALVATIGGQSGPGRMAFKDAAGPEIVLPLSFRGLSQAMNALLNEGR